MPPINKSTLIITLGCFVIFGSMGIYSLVHKQNSILREYPRVEVEMAISGRIIFKEISKSSVRIKLLNNQKFTLSTATNYNYSPPDLNIFLKIGDQIEKKSNSDSLLIVRDNQLYIFRLGKVLEIRP